MRQMLMGLRIRFQAWQARNRMESLREKFSWLEAACYHAGEDELSSMVASIWAARRKGEQRQAMLALMFRNHTHYGALQPARKEGARVDG